MSEIKEITETPTKAEQLYLLSALIKNEAELDGIVEYLKKFDVKIKKSESLGPKTLSFPVKKHHELILISIFFTTDPSEVGKIEKGLHHEEEVLRFLLTDWKGDMEQRQNRPRKKYDKDEKNV